MSVEGWFALPFYTEYAEGKEYDDIQKELFDTYNQLEFTQNPQWNSDTHELSPNPFGSDTLFEYKCFNFLNFLDRSLNQYITNVYDNHRTREDMNDIPPYSPETINYNYVVTSSWFTKTKKGKHAHSHDHNGLDISGVYYLQTNECDGSLVFEHPLRMLSNNFIMWLTTGRDQSIIPQNGKLILWPAYLKHRVETNTTDDDRISISFNIKITGSSSQPI
tara:strand:+ start:595 stop:1251 length:657 start_codon:yes stop_codon:yes gene_type:complete